MQEVERAAVQVAVVVRAEVRARAAVLVRRALVVLGAAQELVLRTTMRQPMPVHPSLVLPPIRATIPFRLAMAQLATG